MIEEIIVAKKPYLFKTKKVFKEKEIEDKKALRAEEIVTSKVEVDGMVFNTDENSMDRMDRVISLAGVKFNKLLAQNTNPIDAYNLIYKNTLLGWKTDDNKFVEVSIEVLVQVQESALNALNEIWVKYG